MKKVLLPIAVLSIILAACGDVEVEENKVQEEVKVEVKEITDLEIQEQVELEEKNWDSIILELANNDMSAPNKYYALEKFMLDYKNKATAEEVKLFKNDILQFYNSGSYLADPTNDELMLGHIFKSYIVERYEKGAWNDFAFDLHQNLKYVYRGVDAPESESVKSNENQMNRVLSELK